ncbi:unnamed protein product [Brachionus calyciflorus]|uniref:Uncharacterized protein n=1 Tax=Brachionus calyciflorus TaxID=104777 RepID=A0A813W239_9BILA|nr:unnamed protein product [Brachionus calyciflorus]
MNILSGNDLKGMLERGGVAIPNELKKSIEDFLKEKSNIASNRLFVNKNPTDTNYKKLENARYLEDQISELYKSFPFSNEISKSTFYKYSNVSGEFKNPYRWTDLCDYCESGKRLKIEIENLMTEMNFEIQETFDLKKTIDISEKRLANIETILQNDPLNQIRNSEIEKLKDILTKLKSFQTVIFHKNVAKTQRAAYNKQTQSTTFLEGKILIEVDFKQRITIGLSPRQINKEYYSQTTRSCLGFGIYFLNGLNQIELINFDIISSDLCEDARAVVRGFWLLREQDFFKDIEKKNYVIWMDCGKHFRNCEVVGYLLKELAEDKIQG